MRLYDFAAKALSDLQDLSSLKGIGESPNEGGGGQSTSFSMTSPNGSRINIFSKKNFENIQAGLKQRGLLFHNLQTSEQYALKSEGRKGFLGLSVYSSWVDKVEVSGRSVIITTKSGKSYTTPLKNNEEQRGWAKNIARSPSVGKQTNNFWKIEG